MAMKIPTTPTKSLEHKLTALREYSEDTKHFTNTTRQSLDQFKLLTAAAAAAAAATTTTTTAANTQHSKQRPTPPTVAKSSEVDLSIDDLRNYDAFQKNPTINVSQSSDTPTTTSTTTIPIPTPRIGISRSQDDDYIVECVEQKFGSVSPIPTPGHRKGSISAIGAARATNFRQKFRKSHTCGSLFAKCNCNEIETTATCVPAMTLQGVCTQQSLSPSHLHAHSQSQSASQATSSNASFEYSSTASAAAAASAQGMHISPHSFYHSISPSSHNDSLSLSQSTRYTSSGVYSLSTQTSSATSTQLSRDESMSASFDLSFSNNPNTLPAQANSENQLTVRRQLVTSLSESQAPVQNSNTQRISSASEHQQLAQFASLQSNATQSTASQKQDRKSRRLFQSYSHPDTDFIFTHANKHPSRECLVSQNQEHVITTRGGKVEIKHPKRTSSPNIGHYQVLDVAVHPDILVKISPKHSPNIEQRKAHNTNPSQQQQQSQATRSAQQRRRLLQRSHEIDSGGSTSESEHSFEQRQALALDFTSPALKSLQETSNPLSTSPRSPLLKTKPFVASSSPIPTTVAQDTTLSAAQKYFAESGILGPIASSPVATPTTPGAAAVANNLIRKTSKILQDVNVIEQIRKTSMILRASSASNLFNKKNSNTSTTAPTPTNDSNTTPTIARSTLTDCTNYVNMETPATIIYAPATSRNAGSPTYATTCGFSPNLTTQRSQNTDDRDAQIKSLQGEIVSLKDVIKSRDAEIMKLRREIHKLKSVLHQTTNHLPIAHDDLLQSPTSTSATAVKTGQQRYYLLPQQCTDVSTTCKPSTPDFMQKTCSCCKQPVAQTQETVSQTIVPETISSTSALSTNTKMATQSSDTATVACALAAENVNVALDTLATLPCNGAKPKILNATTMPVLKKQGVSAESCEQSMQQSFATAIPTYEKDYTAKQLIKDAIMDNDFLKNIDASQVRELVESMYPLSIAKGEFVIREGEVGAHLYVSAEGEFEVVKNDKVLGVMGPGKAFGELAILYNCTRTASIRVLCDARVWVLDRRVFQQIMMRTGMQRIENSVNFLRSVPLLKNLSEEVLAKIADVLEVEFYPAGTYIIRQGATGDTFFLISQGSVKVTQKLTPSTEEKEIRILERGDYFGEQALINEDKRTANIIALAPGVECLTLDRESFTHLIGDLCELKEKNYGDENRVLAMKYAESTKEVFGANVKQEFPDLQLTDLEVVSTLGIGGFGRVELVKAYHQNRVDIFALKCLKKRHILETKQEEHVFSERTIMLTCNSPFICRLYRTFRDEKYVYMLLEACMGGEIWTMLRDRGSFDDNATQFIIGCVLQAFEYLHARGIIYRDLKPENLMLDERGYVKLVDFGFAKYIGNSSKTWTFCGTPEYVAPEIILNKGHDRAVDYWALGILIHELLNGTPPFTANDPMKTYNIILKGIDMITFPKHMSRSAIQLIKRLCRDVPAERLGYQKGGIQDIKKHKWFLGFDWDGLEQQLLIPPFVRPIAHPTDTTYFDQFPCDSTETPDELSGWDEGF